MSSIIYRLDDIGDDDSTVKEIISIFEETGRSYILGVIPRRLTKGMVQFISTLQLCQIFQHGVAHVNRVLNGYPDEFPESLSAHRVRQELSDSKALLENCLCKSVRGYIPPWNNTSRLALDLLPTVGFSVLSGHVRYQYATTMKELHVTVDPVVRYRPVSLMSADELLCKIIAAYTGDASHVGIVIHPHIMPGHYLQPLRSITALLAARTVTMMELTSVVLDR